jgi:hypothetical protein
MVTPDYGKLLEQLVHGDSTQQEAARRTLYAMDEAAIEPLTDQFYAGVDERTGLAIIAVVSDIGGYEALSLLMDITHHGRLETWRAAAKDGLQRNGREIE